MIPETLPNGDRIPVLGLGTWRVGGGMTADYSQDERELAGIRAAIDLGYTHIDTAEIMIYSCSARTVKSRPLRQESCTASFGYSVCRCSGYGCEISDDIFISRCTVSEISYGSVWLACENAESICNGVIFANIVCCRSVCRCETSTNHNNITISHDA